MKIPNVLIIADKEDVRHLDVEGKSRHWNMLWKIIDYSNLPNEIDELQRLVREHNIDFVLYSRNDQVADKISIGWVTRNLGVGYSSFSGIDQSEGVSQMLACFYDFLECDRKLEFESAPRREVINTSNRGTFSLLFDTEQLGGVRFGLPRILDSLNKYGVPATFFITNIIKKVYSNILLELDGHEIGIHGMWHEYLSGLDEEEQKNLIQDMIADMGVEVKGANFLGRMDENSIPTFAENKISYLVYPLINYYWLFSYPKLPTAPSLVRSSGKDIWALPISVETYGSPWFSIRNMIDSAISQGVKCGFPHISILCHPFRDGNLQHIKTTEKMLQHLVKRGLSPITLKDLVSRLHSVDYQPVIEVARFLEQPRVKLAFPVTRQDYLGFVPQNLILAYSLLRRRHTLF